MASLKMTWVARIFDENFHQWQFIPYLLFLDIGGREVIFHHNSQLSQQCVLIPKITQNSFRKWYKHGQMLANKNPQMHLKSVVSVYETGLSHRMGKVCIIDISLQKVSSEFKTSLIKMGYFCFGPMLRKNIR